MVTPVRFTLIWADFTLKEAINLVEDFVAQALEHNKPIVMSEWGIRKTAPLRDPAHDNHLVYPDEQGYEQERLASGCNRPGLCEKSF